MAEFKGVRAKGAGIEIRFEIAGDKYSFYTDQRPTPTNLQDAARRRKSLIEAIKRGEIVHEKDVVNPTFEECCRMYLKSRHQDLKPSTRYNYSAKLEQYWSPLAHRKMKEIRLPHLREADRNIEWKSQKTRRNALSILKQVFTFAMDEDILDVDPSVKLKAGKWQKPEIDAFSAEEKRAILEQLTGKYQVFYTLQFETGARTGELQALKWPDYRGDTLRIERSMFKGQVTGTKTHSARNVLLTNAAKETLNSFTESRFLKGWIFLNYEGNPFAHDRSLTLQFKKACEKAEVRYRRPYYARHTFATHALMAGCEPGFVATQMGDRLETVFRNYATWISGDQDKAQLALLQRRTGKELGKDRATDE